MVTILPIWIKNLNYTTITEMRKAERELEELKMALNYCHLNHEEILEDYRDYMQRCQKNTNEWDGTDRRIYYLSRFKHPQQRWKGLERRS